MRLLTILPTLLAVASAAAGAAESTPLQEFGSSMGDRLNAAARTQDAAKTAAYAEAAKLGVTGSTSPVANAYRDAAIGQAAAAHQAAESRFDARPLSGGQQAAQFLGAAIAATGTEAVAMAQATQPLFLVEAAGTVAREWQGSSALFSIDFGRLELPQIAVGVAVERLAIADEPVVGAVEGVVRVGLPMMLGGRLCDGRMSIGPTISGRAGATFDGNLVVGIDASLHAEFTIAPGIGLVGDIGAGQRATSHEASDIQPVISFGVITVF